MVTNSLGLGTIPESVLEIHLGTTQNLGSLRQSAELRIAPQSIVKDGAKMVAGRVDTKPAEATP